MHSHFLIVPGKHFYNLNHKVKDSDNHLGVGDSFPGLNPKSLHDPDLYAVEKELYLGNLCQVNETNTTNPWQFWMVMLKNGNYDTKSGLCPDNGKKIPPFDQPGRFPCFGNGCMNQPTLNHQLTAVDYSSGSGPVMRGGFNGSYGNGSYYEVIWEKTVGNGSWKFDHRLKTTTMYPWLMLYLRADATKGFSGGYHYETRGMLTSVCFLSLFSYAFLLSSLFFSTVLLPLN